MKQQGYYTHAAVSSKLLAKPADGGWKECCLLGAKHPVTSREVTLILIRCEEDTEANMQWGDFIRGINPQSPMTLG